MIFDLPLLFLFLTLFLTSALIFSLIFSTQAKKRLLLKEEELKHRLYEISILKELQEKIGYSLEVEKIIEMITATLGNFFTYSTVSALILKEGEIFFKSFLLESVSPNFVKEVKRKMCASLAELLGEKIKENQIPEKIQGAVFNEESQEPLASFFNIPLVIEEKVEGLINIASTRSGLYQEGEMTILYKIIREASETISRLRKLLRDLEKMRQEFMTLIVHELRSPLTIIKSGSETILAHQKNLPPKTIRQILFSLKTAAENLLNLVNDLLDAAKMEAGKFTIVPQKTTLLPILEEVKKSFLPLAQEKNLALKVSFPKNLPPLKIDKERLCQVLNNLLSNSIKFTPKGKVELGALQKKNEIVISVRDTGVGIAPQEQDKLFNRFSQILNPGEGKKPGTGLGLLIAKGIVETHGGKIWLESEPGKGSTFFFSLPLA